MSVAWARESMRCMPPIVPRATALFILNLTKLCYDVCMQPLLRNKHRLHDPVWHVQIAVGVAIVLQLALPTSFRVGSRFVGPIVELLLLVALSFTTPHERIFKSLSRRINVFLLIA